MFETHKLNDLGFAKVNEFKTTMSETISKAMLDMPEGREKSIFRTKLEEAVFFGTKAIASASNNFTERIDYPEYGKQAE